MSRSFQPVTPQILSLKRVDKVSGLLGIGMAIVKYERNKILNSTAQKMKKSFMENFIFCAV